MILCIKVVHWPQILDLNRNADALTLKSLKEIGIITEAKSMIILAQFEWSLSKLDRFILTWLSSTQSKNGPAQVTLVKLFMSWKDVF